LSRQREKDGAAAGEIINLGLRPSGGKHDDTSPRIYSAGQRFPST